MENFLSSYNFTLEEVYAMYRLIRYHLGFLPQDDPELTEVMKHICEVVDTKNELATKYHKTA